MVPSRPDDFKTLLGKALASRGLIKDAIRLEAAGRIQFEADGNCDEWRTWHEWDPNLRFTQPYANKIAEKAFAKYRQAESLLDELFTKLRFTFLLSATPAAKSFLFAVNRLLKRYAPDHIRNIGAHECLLIVKVIYFGILNDITAGEITARLPRGASFSYEIESARDYTTHLRRLCRADLPSEIEQLANFAWVIKRVHLNAAGGSVYTAFYHINKYESPLKVLPARPRNPTTGMLALRHTRKHVPTIKREEIEVDDWEQYPDDYENDATTPAEHAAMLEPHSPHPPDDDSREHERHETERRA